MTVALSGGLLAAPWATSLGDHLSVHDPLPAASGEEVLALAEAAGLRGRGGAGFPIARKLRAAQQARGRPLLVVNGTEGEPAIRKDRTLLTSVPHLVLDGAVLAARAVGARGAVLAVHPGPALDATRRAVAERPGDRLRVHEVPSGYVAGEASAVVRSVLGGPSLPTVRDVPMAVRGPGGRPVVVSNAESLAALAVQVRHPGSPVTVLLTVAGTVLEAEVGTTIGEALARAGVGPVQAVLAGGFAGVWVSSPQAPISHAAGTLAAGLLLPLDAGSCGLATTATIVRYLAGQGVQQCGPCRNGMPALAAAVAALAAGDPPRGTVERVRQLAGVVDGRGACGLPDGAAGLVRSALEVFAADVDRHLTGGCGRPAAEVPT